MDSHESAGKKRLLARSRWFFFLFWFGCLCTLAGIQSAWAQVSGHQRLGVQTERSWEATIGLACSLIPDTDNDNRLPDVDSRLSLGLVGDRKWSFSLSVPFLLSSLPGKNPSLLCIPGDIGVTLGGIAHSGDSRIHGAFNLTVPSALWQGNQEVPGSLAGGQGWWIIGLAGGVSHIIDPLVLSGFLAWSVGLPQVERWERLWRPGDFTLLLSMTEAFNENVSFTLGLYQYASFPEEIWDTSALNPWTRLKAGNIGYEAVAELEFLYSGQSFSASLGFSKGLVRGADPASVNFAIVYRIKQKDGA